MKKKRTKSTHYNPNKMEKSIKKLGSHKQDAWPCNGANKYQPKKTEDAEQRRLKFRVCWLWECFYPLPFKTVTSAFYFTDIPKGVDIPFKHPLLHKIWIRWNLAFANWEMKTVWMPGVNLHIIYSQTIY